MGLAEQLYQTLAAHLAVEHDAIEQAQFSREPLELGCAIADDIQGDVRFLREVRERTEYDRRSGQLGLPPDHDQAKTSRREAAWSGMGRQLALGHCRSEDPADRPVAV